MEFHDPFVHAFREDGHVRKGVELSDEMLAWAVRRSDASLLAAVNAFLNKAQNNGELNQTLRRWIPRLQ